MDGERMLQRRTKHGGRRPHAALAALLAPAGLAAAILATSALRPACAAEPAGAAILFPHPTLMAAPATPARAPDFDYANLQGGTLRSVDLRGKVVLIRFWATW
jgi:hypothetical protein